MYFGIFMMKEINFEMFLWMLKAFCNFSVGLISMEMICPLNDAKIQIFMMRNLFLNFEKPLNFKNIAKSYSIKANCNNVDVCMSCRDLVRFRVGIKYILISLIHILCSKAEKNVKCCTLLNFSSGKCERK
jgi:hypothetical protein